jgi:hypothetical protein
MKGRIADFFKSLTSGKQRITFEVDGDISEIIDKYKDIDVEIIVRPHRKKRSLNANAYMWTLVGKLAEAMNLPANEIYRNAIKQVGVWQDILFDSERPAKTMTKSWEDHGIGWMVETVDDAGDDGILMRFYYGSSVYNTRQMSRLIDNVVADCRELGIETMTPAELAGLIENWDKQKRSEKDAE